MAQKQNAKLQQKKQKKAERRNKRQAKQRVREAERAVASRYPKFRVAAKDGADPEFIDIVTKATKQIDFENQRGFYERTHRFYRIMAHRGVHAVARYFARLSLELDRVAFDVTNALEAEEHGGLPMKILREQVNEALFDLIPEEARRRFLPYHNIFVVPHERHFQVSLSKICTRRTPGGTIFFCPTRPTVTVDGKEKIIAFTRHAIERICERISPGWWRSFREATCVSEILYNCKSFEPCMLHPDQPGIIFRGSCGSLIYDNYDIYVGRVLGEENLESNGGDVHYRVGYCPVVVHGEFAVAKTLLLPGYRATPEYGLIRRSNLPYAEKSRLMDTATHQDVGSSWSEESIELTKWFHENGVPQVTQTGNQLVERSGTRRRPLRFEPSTPTGLLPVKLEELCTV